MPTPASCPPAEELLMYAEGALHIAPHAFELQTRVERSTISLGRTFEGEYHGTVPPDEVREALLQALEVSIL